MEKIREDFESWLTAYGIEFSVNVVNERLGLPLSYAPFRAEIAWQAWQASRNNLCVELPSQWYDERTGDEVMTVSKVIDCLDKSGVSYA